MASARRKSFLFLNQSSNSGPRSQRERELQDADRRAHAARNSKSKRHVTLTDKVVASTRSRPSTKSIHHWAEESQQDDSPSPTITRKRQLVVRSRTPEAKQARSPQTDTTGSPTSALSLGQGNGDPFDTASVEGLPSFIYGILDHC